VEGRGMVKYLWTAHSNSPATVPDGARLSRRAVGRIDCQT
jgi:hypothetical protein